MKKLRITVDGKVFDVSVELLDQVSSTTSAPAPAPVAAPSPAPAASAPVAAPAPAPTPAPAPPPPVQETCPARSPAKSFPWTLPPGTAVKAGDPDPDAGSHEDEHHHLRSRLRHAHRFLAVSAGDTVQEGQALAKIG